MPSRTVFAGVALLAFTSVTPERLQAQADSPLLPSSLVAALLWGNRATGIAPNAHFVTGALPAGWPSSATPLTPATVLGGMTSGQVLVAVFADTTQRFLEKYLKALQEYGWAPWRESSIQTGGLQASGYLNGTLLCRDSSGITAIPAPGAKAGALVHVTYKRAEPNCVYRIRPAAPVALPAQLTFPPLRPPRTSKFPSFGGSSSSGDISTRVRLVDSTLGAGAMLAHYAAQLVAAGWVPGEYHGTYTDQVAAQGFDALDKSGRRWTGSLSVISTKASRDVTITMWLDDRK